MKQEQEAASAVALREAPLPAAEQSAAEQNTEEPKFFANRKEALRWMQQQGYKIGQYKFYTDVAEKGFPVLTIDGRLSRYQVQVYAENLAARKQQAKTPAAISRSDDLARKERAEADMAEMKSERMRREESEYWLPAADAWSVIAGLMDELRRAIRQELHDSQLALVQAAGGDTVRSPELYEAADQAVSRAFNTVAGNGLDIQWETEK